MPSFTEFFNKHDLVHMMLGIADPYTVYRLRTVSRPVLEVVDRYLKSAFNIDRFLQQRFIADPVAFRSMMAQTGCVIGGLTALEFFERGEWSKPALELFVDSANVAQVCWYLVDVCGYCFAPRGSSSMASLDQALDPATWKTGRELYDNTALIGAEFRFEGAYRGICKRVIVSSPHPHGALAAAILSSPTSKIHCHKIVCLLISFDCSGAAQRDYCQWRILCVPLAHVQVPKVTLPQNCIPLA